MKVHISSRFVQMHIFWKLYMIDFLWLLIGLELLKLQQLIYPRLLAVCSTLVLSQTKVLLNFIWGFWPYFPVRQGLEWFWILGSLRKNSQLMLVHLKAPLLVLSFSYYTLMTFLMLSVILLSMLMILLYSTCDRASGLW